MQPSFSPAIQTELCHSLLLSCRINCEVYLKLEMLHPSGSYKYRGVFAFIQAAHETYGDPAHIISVFDGDGDGSFAAVFAAEALGVQCSIFAAKDASPRNLEKIRSCESSTILLFEDQQLAVAEAAHTLQSDHNAVLLPGDNEISMWQGYSSLIAELQCQLYGEKPDLIVSNVGNGSLLGGLLRGCDIRDWADVPIIAVEEYGNDCFYHSMLLNTASDSTYVLSSHMKTSYNSQFGVYVASFVSPTKSPDILPAVVNMALRRKGTVKCVTIPYELSIYAAVRFSEDLYFVTSRECSAALAPIYNSSLLRQILPSDMVERDAGNKAKIVFIIDGAGHTDLCEYSVVGECEERLRAGMDACCDGKKVQILADAR